MGTSFLIILLIVTIAISVSQLGVILFFVNFIKKNELHDGAVREAKEKSAAVIASAVEKANEVIAQAEKANLQKVEAGSSVISQLSKQFEEKIETLEEKAESGLTKSSKSAETEIEKAAKTAQSSYSQLVSQSQTALGKMIAEDKEILEGKMNETINQSNQMFQQFMAQLGNQVKAQLQGELTKAKAEVEEYKKDRIATMDEKIIDILEEVLLTTLGKKLTLKDEGEFVFEALETAKREHAFDTT